MGTFSGSSDKQEQQTFIIKFVSTTLRISVECFLIQCILHFQQICFEGNSSPSLSLSGGCTFDDGPGACDYHQDLYDDFEWVHVSAQEPHYLPPEMPQGENHSIDLVLKKTPLEHVVFSQVYSSKFIVVINWYGQTA